jgi:hypothetical protein
MPFIFLSPIKGGLMFPPGFSQNRFSKEACGICSYSQMNGENAILPLLTEQRRRIRYFSIFTLQWISILYFSLGIFSIYLFRVGLWLVELVSFSYYYIPIHAAQVCLRLILVYNYIVSTPRNLNKNRPMRNYCPPFGGYSVDRI